MLRHRSRRGMSTRVRRGISTVQYVLVAALITLAVAGGVALFGTRTNNKLNQTASDVANPAALVNRFGS